MYFDSKSTVGVSGLSLATDKVGGGLCGVRCGQGRRRDRGCETGDGKLTTCRQLACSRLSFKEEGESFGRLSIEP